MAWWVYIIECNDRKLYTGTTNNLKRRIREHNSGNGCRFTKYRIPVKLMYEEELPDKNIALLRESEIKGLTKAKKLLLSSAGPSACRPQD